MRDCAEGHRAGQPGQTQDRRRTTTKAAKRLLFVLLLLLLPVVITFVVGLGTVCGHGRAELRCTVLCLAGRAIDCPWINKTHFNRTVAEHTRSRTRSPVTLHTLLWFVSYSGARRRGVKEFPLQEITNNESPSLITSLSFLIISTL